MSRVFFKGEVSREDATEVARDALARCYMVGGALMFTSVFDGGDDVSMPIFPYLTPMHEVLVEACETIEAALDALDAIEADGVRR